MMPYTKFQHATELVLKVGPEGGEDTVEVEVMLECEGSYTAATNDYWDRGLVVYLPGDPAETEIHLLGVQILADRTSGLYRPAIKADAAGPNDQAIIDAAEEYVDRQGDGLIEDLMDVLSGDRSYSRRSAR